MLIDKSFEIDSASISFLIRYDIGMKVFLADKNKKQYVIL